MIVFSRRSAEAYLVALAVWVAGFAAIIVAGLRGDVPASGGPVVILLILLFAAASTMLAVAVRMEGADEHLRVTPVASSSGLHARWLLMPGLRWVFLSCGVAAPTAFRALDGSGH